MKIKKYTIFILILATFFVVSNSIPKVTLADCSFPYASTKFDCESVGGTWDSTGTTASTCAALKGIANIICKIHNILNSIIPVLVALGIVYFVWGVVQYVIGDEGEAKKKGRDHIMYGIIGLAVIVGLWGLVNIIVNTFGIAGNTPPLPSAGITGTGTCEPLNNPNLQLLLGYGTCILNRSVVPFIFAIALVMFIWGVVQFVINSSEEAKKEKGRQFMLWGIIGLAVMVSVWGLVNVLGQTFGLNTGVIPQASPTRIVSP